MGREVAEIVHQRGCFSLRPRRPATLDVLTAASAAAKVLQDEGNPAVLWLDIECEAMFLTERWAGDVVTKRLPLQLDVARLPHPVQASAEEVVVATIAFTDRDSLELFAELGLRVLPEWLSIRQGALGRNLLVAHGHWILSYHGQALKLQCGSADLVGLLRLNLGRPGIELLVASGQGPVSRTEVVGSLQLACKVLRKHVPGKLHLDKAVQQAIQSLQPCLQSLQKLKGQLDGSIQCTKGAASMHSWISGGIIAALVDCAAALPAGSSLQQQHYDQQQWQLQGQGSSDDCFAVSEVMRSISGCLCVVLLNAEKQMNAQARLLLDCITRCLWGSQAQVLNAAQLLGAVLQQLTGDGSTLWHPMQQECQDPALLQQLLYCYSNAAPGRHSMQGRTPAVPSSGPWSHPVAWTWDNEPEDESAADRPADVAAVRAGGAGSPVRRPVVPRLSLPFSMPATPQVHLARSSRLSRRASDAVSGARHTADAQPGSTVSFVAALQRLGHSCGESVMAADLAAFVTHKQLHASEALGARDHGRQGTLTGQTAGAPAEGQATGKQGLLGPEQLCRLPLALQLQLQLLWCMHLIVQQLPAGYLLPRSLGHVLLEQLLLARSLLPQELMQDRQSQQLLGCWLQQRQQLSIQLLARCTQPPSCHQQIATEGSMLNPSGGTLLPQFRQRLLDICSAKQPGGSSCSLHEECRDVLLLLRDYLHSVARPHVAEAACCAMGHVLGQVEHLLRGSRVSLWSWPAVQAMDALVQVYVELATQATSPLAVSHLLQMLGSQQAGSSSFSGAAFVSVDGTAAALVPADTLQLVLDFLQQRLPAGHMSARSSRAGDGRGAALAGPAWQAPQPGRGSEAVGASVHRAAGTPAARTSSSIQMQAGSCRQGTVAVAEAAAEAHGAEAKQANAVKAHCWQLLTAVIQLAAKWQQASRPDADAASTPSSLSWYAASSSPGHTSSIGSECQPQKQQSGAALAAARHSSRLTRSSTRSSCSGLNSSRYDEHAAAAMASSASSEDAARFQGQLLETKNAHVTMPYLQCASDVPAAAAAASSQVFVLSPSCTPLNLDAVGLLASAQQPAEAAAGSASSQAGSEALRLLVDLLLRQRGGRAYAVAQLDELDGSQAALPLQLEVLNFVATAFGVPNSYPLIVPQLAEFYVHYHLLHFTRQYYKLPTAPGHTVAACCKGHIKVLLALCRHTGGANLVRRRFLQLKVLDFLVRELSLEHSLVTRQQQGQGSSSCATTPASTARSSARSTLGPLSAASKVWSTAAGAAAATAAAGGGFQQDAEAADNVLTERGVSGLLSFSVSSLNISQQPCLQEQQDSSAPAAGQLSIEAAGRSPRQCGEACSPWHPEDQEASFCSTSATAGSFGTIGGPAGQLTARSEQDASAGLGTVQSAVKKFEAAAAAARAGVPVTVKVLQPPAGRQPGSSRVVALSAGVDAAASCSHAVPHLPGPNHPEDPQPSAGPRARHAATCISRQGHFVSSSSNGDSSSDGRCSSQPGADGVASSHDEGGIAAAGSDDGAGVEQPASSQLYGDWEQSEEFDCELESPPARSSKPVAKLTLGWQGLGSGSSQATSSSASGPPTVPRLAFGVPAVQAAGAVLASLAASGFGSDDGGGNGGGDDSGSEYRPGFDLEEDFERMMSAEESGRQGSWTFNSDCEDSSSDCSSLIAAGRDTCEEQQAGAGPAQAGCSKPLLPPLLLAAAAEGSGGVAPPCCSCRAVHDSSDTLSGADAGSSRERLCGVQSPGGAVAAATASPVLAAAAAAAVDDGDASEYGGSLCEEVCLEDAVGLHDEDEGQGAQASCAGGSAHSSRSPARRALVPHLNLPTSQHCLLDSPGSSTASPAHYMAVPSLLAAATPLMTSRPPAHAPPSSSAAADARSPLQLQRQACMPPQANAAAVAAADVSTSRTRYCMHRRTRAIYVDRELHVLCLELALHLLSSPSGLLDPLQLPQDPTDTALQQKVLILLAHLSEPENIDVARALADRAHTQMQPQLGSDCASNAHGARSAGAARSYSAATTLSGLAGCTRRLLKLLSPAMLGAGRLQFGSTIQQGAFSEVQAATLLHGAKPVHVAVKVVGSAGNDSSCFERVHNEVAILESLRGHKGIVPLLEYGAMCGSRIGLDAGPQQQPQWLLVFPRYSGSLRAWRQQRGAGLQRQDIALYLHIFLQVASTVAALHASNIVHYDIKGDNLLLDTNTPSCSNGSSSGHCLPFDVVLADFGDALMFDAAGSAFAQRHRGTELFSSPEMLLLHAGQQNPGHEQHDRRKHRGVGRAHDVWSLGCTLYELLTGRVLFENEGVGRITSYAPSSCTGGNTAGPGGSAASSGSSGGVLGRRERAALAGHPGVIDLVEFMLVGNANWRPGAPEVVCKTQLLLASVEASRG